MMLLNKPCFCGSAQEFSSCCQPFLNQDAFPIAAEQLMRSRFSAYVLGNSQYIYDTYAKSSQAAQSVKEINDWANAYKWLALKIHSAEVINHMKRSPEQFVEFSAFYIVDETLCELRENSRFILEVTEHSNKQEPQWRYIDGDIIKHSELVKIKRNALCPCNHYATSWSLKKGKKFKQCCAK